MLVNIKIFFIYLQILLAYKLHIQVLTLQQISLPPRSPKHCSLNCVIIWIYKHGGFANHQLLAILTDTVFCVEKTPWGNSVFFFFLLLSPSVMSSSSYPRLGVEGKGECAAAFSPRL